MLNVEGKRDVAADIALLKRTLHQNHNILSRMKTLMFSYVFSWCMNPVGWNDEEFVAENSSEITILIERS
ncbi:unnamed protein product [marine sediment metagenome]|uniref:Uncharacterized protein n=1 Tax=marine sediment metagenome TaxID=412755 RepID=X1GUF0_9ZZZZ